MNYIVAGYPKSGTTWVRIFLYLYYYSESLDMDDLERKLPSLSKHLGIFDRFSWGGRKFFKTHDLYSKNSINFTSLYVARDPRSVCVSAYNYEKRIGSIDQSHALGEYVDQFLNGAVLNLNFTWDEHLQSWFNSDCQKVNVFKYEDMLKDPLEQFERIIRLVDVNVDYNKLLSCVEQSSFKNLKDFEEKNGERVTRWKNIDRSIPFFRNGSAEEWRAVLSREQSKAIEDTFQNQMSKLSYI